jgi:hypothetical protein
MRAGPEFDEGGEHRDADRDEPAHADREPQPKGVQRGHEPLFERGDVGLERGDIVLGREVLDRQIAGRFGERLGLLVAEPRLLEPPGVGERIEGHAVAEYRRCAPVPPCAARPGRQQAGEGEDGRADTRGLVA